jgi:hypothetical protein
MTIQEVIDEIGTENYDSIDIHEGTSRADMNLIAEQVVDFDHDVARDYWVEPCSDGHTKLHILVQPEKVIKYVHVGAPAPQYAIYSISRIHSAISFIASLHGIYAREERSRNRIPVNIILVPDVTDEQVEQLFSTTKDYMEAEGYTGVESSPTGLTYDAGTASIEDGEPTRNW